MTELLTAAQMRSIEQAAIGSGEVTGLELMERAGRGVVEAIFEEWPELGADRLAGRGASPSRSPGYLQTEEGVLRALVLCGPGNNGGDGFVVARLLKEMGWAVEVFLYGGAGKLPPDADTNYQRWSDDADVHGIGALGAFFPLSGHVLLIDAIFGTGQSRSVDAALEPYHHCMDRLSNLSCPVTLRSVSIDIPTGYHTDTGDLLAVNPFEPDLIVSFHRLKRVHGMLEALGYHCVVKDIGL
jgi:hydroxyethylthiazole kinase-like uncharacterized protein yjeF